MRRTKTRAVTAAQAAAGIATVAAAVPVAGRIGGPRWVAAVIGVLGLRQVAQAALVYTVDDPLFLRGGAAVDALHAASMVPLALMPKYRAAALTSAAIATASAVAGLAAAD